MRRVYHVAVRATLLGLLAGLVHLALLWLLDPWLPVPPPRVTHVDSAEREPRPARPGEVVVLFGGDTAPTDAALPTLRRQGYEHAYAATLGLLRESDLSVVNLEAPVTEREQPFPLYKRYIYKVHPSALEALRWAGVGAVTLANNHLMDYGPRGVLDTLRHLEQGGIVAIGAGRSAAEARRGSVFSVRGTRIGILSYLQDSLMHSVYVRSFAGPAWPGCARLGVGTVRRDIARLRRSADVVIVAVHWGAIYDDVTWYQRLFGRVLIDAGADLVVGHHPHVHQPVGAYRGKLILFSLGNFAFGTPGHSTFRYGLLARLRLRGRALARVELIPLVVQNRLVQFKPEPVRGAEARVMLEQLARQSFEYGARLRVEGAVAVWERAGRGVRWRGSTP